MAVSKLDEHRLQQINTRLKQQDRELYFPPQELKWILRDGEGVVHGEWYFLSDALSVLEEL